jgi:hypothetical protein
MCSKKYYSRSAIRSECDKVSESLLRDYVSGLTAQPAARPPMGGLVHGSLSILLSMAGGLPPIPLHTPGGCRAVGGARIQQLTQPPGGGGDGCRPPAVAGRTPTGRVSRGGGGHDRSVQGVQGWLRWWPAGQLPQRPVGMPSTTQRRCLCGCAGVDSLIPGPGQGIQASGQSHPGSGGGGGGGGGISGGGGGAGSPCQCSLRPGQHGGGDVSTGGVWHRQRRRQPSRGGRAARSSWPDRLRLAAAVAGEGGGGGIADAGRRVPLLSRGGWGEHGRWGSGPTAGRSGVAVVVVQGTRQEIRRADHI